MDAILLQTSSATICEVYPTLYWLASAADKSSQVKSTKEHLNMRISNPAQRVQIPKDLGPRGSKYQIIKDLGPKSQNNHGL